MRTSQLAKMALVRVLCCRRRAALEQTRTRLNRVRENGAREQDRVPPSRSGTGKYSLKSSLVLPLPSILPSLSRPGPPRTPFLTNTNTLSISSPRQKVTSSLTDDSALARLHSIIARSARAHAMNNERYAPAPWSLPTRKPFSRRIKSVAIQYHPRLRSKPVRKR